MGWGGGRGGGGVKIVLNRAEYEIFYDLGAGFYLSECNKISDACYS